MWCIMMGMKRQSAFRSRLFFSYSALIVLSVGLFLLALTVIILRTGEAEARAQQGEAARHAVRQCESALRGLDALAAQAASNAELIGYFVPLKDDPDPGNFFDDNPLEYIDASSLLATLNGAAGTAARISVYNAHGDYVSAGSLYETPERKRLALADEARIAAQFHQLSVSAERRVIDPPDPDPFSTSQKSRLFAILRPLSSAYVSEVYGIVSVQQDASALEKLGLTRQTDQEVCVIVTDDGQAVAPAQAALSPLAQAAALAAKSLQPKEPGTIAQGTLDTDQGKLFVSAARMDLSGWLVVMAQPQSQLRAAYRTTILLLLLAGAALAVVLLGVVYFMSDRITRPVSDLSFAIERVSLTHMQLPAHQLSGISEVEALDSAFRTMLSRLNDAIGLEMRAYFYALQSQMNPHFLYNVLSVISASGDEEGAKRTVKMVSQLSGMLRYVASYEQEQATTLADEVRYAEQYLRLMKVRYEDNFHYTIDLEAGAAQVPVPKLILQPLCENCFKHGFQSVRPPWRIKVTVQLQGGRFLVTVADNGCGMTDAEVRALTAKIDDCVEQLAGNYRALSVGGMGLTNTVLRLRLSVGDAAYSVLRGPEGGMIVQLSGRAEG